MPYDRHLAELLDEAMADRDDIAKRKMFGGYCWMLNGNMLCGVEVGRFMFRLGKELQDEALQRPGTELITFNGRKMGGMVWVEEDHAIKQGLDSWIALAERFVGTLPAK